MNFRYLILAIAAIAIAIGLIFGLAPRKPKTIQEQASYTIGFKFGQSLKAQKFDLHGSEVGHGISDAMIDGVLLSEEEMRLAMKAVADQQQKDIGEMAEKNKAVADTFFEKNKNAPGVKVSASGLQYKIIEEGSGAQPKLEDTAVIK